MEPGPLPPHERAWRHPSELGPPPHEPTSTTGRLLIVTSATVSLLLVGLLVITMTPDQTPSPTAAGSTVGDATAGRPVIAASTAAITATALPVVTPIGDEGWAVTTWEAVGGETGWIEARLPSGAAVEIEVIGSDPTTGLVVVTLPVSADTHGYQLAADRPGPSDTVYVHGDQPKVVSLLELAELDVEEGTPVLDAAGELVGLCTDSYDGTALMTVDTMPGDDDVTADDDAETTTVVATSAPETTADAATTVETTTPESTDPASTVVESTVVETTVPDTATPDETVEPSSGMVYPPGR